MSPNRTRKEKSSLRPPPPMPKGESPKGKKTKGTENKLRGQTVKENPNHGEHPFPAGRKERQKH